MCKEHYFASENIATKARDIVLCCLYMFALRQGQYYIINQGIILLLMVLDLERILVSINHQHHGFVSPGDDVEPLMIDSYFACLWLSTV